MHMAAARLGCKRTNSFSRVFQLIRETAWNYFIIQCYIPLTIHCYPFYYTSSFTASSPLAFITTLQHSLLPFSIRCYFSIHYYIQHSLLPFSTHCYHSTFTAAFQHSLLHFSIHCYSSAFTDIFHHPLVPFSIHSYSSVFTTTLHHSLLQFIIHYYTSFTAFTAFMLPFQHSLPHCWCCGNYCTVWRKCDCQKFYTL